MKRSALVNDLKTKVQTQIQTYTHTGPYVTLGSDIQSELKLLGRLTVDLYDIFSKVSKISEVLNSCKLPKVFLSKISGNS